MSHELLLVDLRGVAMPEHLRAVTAAVERAARDGAAAFLTDSETALKYAPAAAAQRGLLCSCRRHLDGGWEITVRRNRFRPFEPKQEDPHDH